MNTLTVMVTKVLRIVENKLPPHFRRRQIIRRRFEQQLEFPWLSKR